MQVRQGPLALLILLSAACSTPARFPALTETPPLETEGEDSACPLVQWYGDADGDGYGGQRFTLEACSPPDGYVDNDTDCDDLDGATHPGAEEICGDGVDNDCSDAPEDDCLRLLSEGWPIRGTRPNEGGFISAARDIDGDGIDDIALGVPYSSNGDGQESDGAVAFFFGPHDRSRELSDAALTVVGSPGEKEVVGWAVLLPGDVDGDGIADLTLTATQYDASTGTNAGAVALFSGTTLLSSADSPLTLGLADSDGLWYGANRQVYFGATLTAADMDAEPSTLELISGAPWEDAERGVLYALRSGGGGSVTTAALATFTGETEGDRLGVEGTVAAGDLTGDGIADLAIGAYRHAEDSGSLYLCVGPFSGALVVSDCAARIDAVSAEDQLGRRVALAGDVDGDGLADLWAVSPNENRTAINDGVAYLLLGTPAQASRDTRVIEDVAHAWVQGLDTQDTLGRSIAEGTDIDRDGYADALLGAAQLGQIEQGVAILFYGPLEGAILAGAGDAVYTSADSTDLAGERVAFVHALTAAGQPGLLVDTPEDDQGASNAGATWLVPLTP